MTEENNICPMKDETSVAEEGNIGLDNTWGRRDGDGLEREGRSRRRNRGER